MTGKSHKAIGTAAGFALMSYGIYKGIELAPLALVASPFGSMLPDIDHDRTKLGRKRKKVTDTLKVLVPILIVALLVLVGIEGYQSGDWTSAIFKILVIMFPVAVLSIMAKIPYIKKQWKFAVGHRGFMHTSIICIVCTVVIFVGLDSEALQWLLGGLTIGYASHLFADTLTTDRCPLLWPITTKPIGLGFIKTDTKAEYVAATVISGGLICLGVYLLLLRVVG